MLESSGYNVAAIRLDGATICMLLSVLTILFYLYVRLNYQGEGVDHFNFLGLTSKLEDKI